MSHRKNPPRGAQSGCLGASWQLSSKATLLASSAGKYWVWSQEFGTEGAHRATEPHANASEVRAAHHQGGLLRALRGKRPHYPLSSARGPESWQVPARRDRAFKRNTERHPASYQHPSAFPFPRERALTKRKLPTFRKT